MMLVSTKIQLGVLYTLNYQIGQLEKMREKYITAICKHEHCSEGEAGDMMAAFIEKYTEKEKSDGS